MERYQKLLDISSAQGKRAYSDVLLPVVQALTDPVEQDHYMLAIAETMGVSRDALEAKLQQGEQTATRPLKKPKVTPTPVDKQRVEDTKAQDQFLALVLMQPSLRNFIELVTPDMLFDEHAQQLLDFLRAHPDYDGTADAALKPLADYVKIISLQYEELYHGLELTELRYEAARLQTRLVEQFVKHQKQTVAAQLTDADDDTIRRLLEDVRQLDVLLNQVKTR